MEMQLIVIVIAFLVAIIAGMLGLGGSIILMPAYLLLPGLLGITPLPAKQISGMVSIQVMAVSFMSMLVHRSRGVVNKKIVTTIGIPIVATSFIGSLYSGNVSNSTIIGTFATMALVGALLMIFRKPRPEQPTAAEVEFNRPLAIFIALVVGLAGGIAGAPGSFILSPVMMIVLHIPTRITIGSTLGIILLAATSTGIGKIGAGLVPWDLTLLAIAAALPGAYLGSKLSHLIPAKTLRFALAVVISGISLQMWYQILK